MELTTDKALEEAIALAHDQRRTAKYSNAHWEQVIEKLEKLREDIKMTHEYGWTDY